MVCFRLRLHSENAEIGTAAEKRPGCCCWRLCFNRIVDSFPWWILEYCLLLLLFGECLAGNEKSQTLLDGTELQRGSKPEKIRPRCKREHGNKGQRIRYCFTPNTHNCVKVDEKRISKQQRKLEQQVNGPSGLLWVLTFGTEYDGV